jgi:hypothetical protein
MLQLIYLTNTVILLYYSMNQQDYIEPFRKYNEYVLDRYLECGAIEEALEWKWIDLAAREKGDY